MSDQDTAASRKFLFSTCFIALVATSFAFIIRVMVMDSWQLAFRLTETQKGEIFGAGLWPFGVSIVLFSLMLDKLGYKRSMVFAFVCHVASTLILIAAKGYWGLYIGSVLNGLAAGTVEAVINPAIATMYPKKKTTMLTILHGGWSGGFVLGGLLIMLMGGMGLTSWKLRVCIILVPVLAYGLMLLRCKFPVSERVAAGVSYRDMLREAGALGALVVTFMITKEVGRVFGFPAILIYGLIIAQVGVYFAYTRSLGRPMYIFLLLIMILLATTELGTDTWIKDLMTPSMGKLGIDAGWVLIYTASIMTILRFCISPIEKRLRPLGVLLVSSLFAAVGLFFLSRADGMMILLLATIYGTGQCFFWPVTLGLVAEQFPKGGAVTLNAIAGVGMLGVGILGMPWLGYLQDTRIDKTLQSQPAIYAEVMDPETRVSVLGSYQGLDGGKVNQIAEKTALYRLRQEAREAHPEMNDEALDAVLIENSNYQIALRAACESLGGASGMSYQQMISALQNAGAFVGKEEFERLGGIQETLAEAGTEAKQNAMATVALLPLIMAASYLGLIIYFKRRGGYKIVEISAGE
ncbi:sugar MFS transporter [Candidatus Hydrogenedentota bacterium]